MRNRLHFLDAADLLHSRSAVIFDCDDTILATAQTRWSVLIETAKKFDVELSTDTIRRAWGLPFDELIRALVPTINLNNYVEAY